MAMEIMDLPIKSDGSFHSYVSLPEGNNHNFYGVAVFYTDYNFAMKHADCEKMRLI
jgi:hypothetical protein